MIAQQHSMISKGVNLNLEVCVCVGGGGGRGHCVEFLYDTKCSATLSLRVAPGKNLA